MRANLLHSALPQLPHACSILSDLSGNQYHMNPERPVRSEYQRHFDISSTRWAGYEIHLAWQHASLTAQ